MREIIFRAKMKTDNGKYKKGDWVFGDLVRLKDGEKTLTMIYGFGEVDPSTVGQYTGLTDKNGTKIFEGDIVRIAYCFGWDNEQEKNVPEEKYISKVYSIDGCPFCVDLLHCDGDISPIAWLDWSYDDAEIEVIGNIHDNPELLGGWSCEDV